MLTMPPTLRAARSQSQRTNEDHYLNDPTGERRYWHTPVTYYDREAFLADKDQLYAEAVALEPTENLWLDTPELVAAHDAVVAAAKEPNELVDMLTSLKGEVWHVDGKDEERVSTADIRLELGMTVAPNNKVHRFTRFTMCNLCPFLLTFRVNLP